MNEPFMKLTPPPDFAGPIAEVICVDWSGYGGITYAMMEVGFERKRRPALPDGAFAV